MCGVYELYYVFRKPLCYTLILSIFAGCKFYGENNGYLTLKRFSIVFRGNQVEKLPSATASLTTKALPQLKD